MKQRANKLLAITVTIIILSSSLRACGFMQTVSCISVPEEINGYLLDNEFVTGVESKTFGRGENEVKMKIYALSSGKRIVYSENYGMVVLGNEWGARLGKDADHLALQILSLLTFEDEKPLEIFDTSEYSDLVSYWGRGVEIGKELAKWEVIKKGLVNLAAGVVLLIAAPPAGVAGTIVFFAGYSAGLAVNMKDFIDKFNVNEKNAPRLFLGLSLLPPDRNDAAAANFEEALNKLSNRDFLEGAKELNKGLELLDLDRDASSFFLMFSYAVAARDQNLLNEIAKVVGKDSFEKAGAFFIFDEDKVKFNEFARLVNNVWNAKEKPGALNDFISKNAARSLKNFLSGLLIGLVKDFILEATRDKEQFLGFHTSHSLLIRELSHDISTLLGSFNSGERPATLDNMLSLYYMDYLLHVLLEEYDDGVISLSKDTLCNMYPELLRFWGISEHPEPCMEDWAGHIRNSYRIFRSYHSGAANDTLKTMNVYASKVYRLFEEYGEDMKVRRGNGKPEISGVDLFLLSDTSGSMSSSFRGATKIEAAKKAAADLIGLLSPSDRAGLVRFSSTAELLADLTSDRSALLPMVAGLSAAGETAMGDGLFLALDKLESARPSDRAKAIILLTDGMHNAGVHNPEEAASRASQLGIPIYTVGYGEPGDIDEQMLMKIAGMTGGEYYYSPSPDDLRKLYISLSKLVAGHKVTDVVIGNIKSGQSHSVNVIVEPRIAYLSAALSYSGSSLELALVSPSGRKLTGAEGNVIAAEATGYESQTVYEPEPGEWQVLVVGVSTPPEGLEYRLVTFEPPIALDVDSIVIDVGPGETRKVPVDVRVLRRLSSLKISSSGEIANIVKPVPEVLVNLTEGSFTFDIFVTPPTTMDAIFMRGFLELSAVGSLIYVPLEVRMMNRLLLYVSPSLMAPRADQNLMLTAQLFDSQYRPVTAATVTYMVNGKQGLFTEAAGGVYVTNITGMKEGRSVIIVEVAKSGYASISKRLEITVMPPEAATTTTMIGPIVGAGDGRLPILLAALLIVILAVAIGAYSLKLRAKPVCPRCGTRSSFRGARYCRRCGWKLAEPRRFARRRR